MSTTTFTALFLLLPLANLQIIPPKPRIVGGSECEITDYPFLVSISTANISVNFEKGEMKISQSKCGGSLLTTEWIITAAHCIKMELVTQKRVGVSMGSIYPVSYSGGGTNEKNAQVRIVETAVIYPKYINKEVGEMRYDIGLLKTAEPFKIDPQYVELGKFPQEKGWTNKCKKAFVAGWGVKDITPAKRQTREQQIPGAFYTDPRNHLKCIELPIIDLEACLTSYPTFFFKLDDSVICTMETEAGKDACQGDSGGPLICDNVVIGAVSAGKGCGLANSAATYTKLESYWTWIGDVTGYQIPINSSPKNESKTGIEVVVEKPKEVQVPNFNTTTVSTTKQSENNPEASKAGTNIHFNHCLSALLFMIVIL